MADRENIIKLVPQFDRPAAQQKDPAPTPTRVDPPSPSVTPSVPKSHPGRAAGVSETGHGFSGGKPPTVGVGKGRIQFSLNPISLCISFGVLLVVVIGAYQFGRDKTDAQARVDDVGALQGQERDASVLDPNKVVRPDTPRTEVARGSSSPPMTVRTATGGTGGSTPAAPSNAAGVSAKPPSGALDAGSSDSGTAVVPTSVREKGLNYLYIVRFRAEHLDDAIHAHKWLSKKGIRTAIDDGGDWLSLVSVEGFDMSNADHKAKRTALEAKLKDLTPVYRQDCRTEQRYRYYAFDKPELRKQKD